MRVVRTPAISAAFVVSLAIAALAQECVDLAVVDRIKSEALRDSADTYDHAVAADLMQASAVIATVVYQTANRTERLSRRALPNAAATR